MKIYLAISNKPLDLEHPTKGDRVIQQTVEADNLEHMLVRLHRASAALGVSWFEKEGAWTN